MSGLEIIVWGDIDPCVEELIFFDSITKQTRSLIRGRVSSKRGGATFHFTSAVQALIVLALRQAAQPNLPVALTGNGPSPALSLEYAILRKPSWIQDLFGVDEKGQPLVLRYFHRINAGFKRAAPLRVAFNPHLLAPEDLGCSSNGRKIVQSSELTHLADHFESLWFSRYASQNVNNFTVGDSI